MYFTKAVCFVQGIIKCIALQQYIVYKALSNTCTKSVYLYKVLSNVWHLRTVYSPYIAIYLFLNMPPRQQKGKRERLALSSMILTSMHMITTKNKQKGRKNVLKNMAS